MENTTSISKGVFIFKNGAKAASKRGRRKKQIVPTTSNNIFSKHLWYQSYSSLWNKIDAGIQDLNKDMFSSVLGNLVSYVKMCYETMVTEIPSAALLTGINMPDHAAQFSALSKQLQREATPHVACLYSQDCQNLKSIVENMIIQFMDEDDSDMSDEEDSDTERKPRLKKSQCNFSFLQAWYEKEHPKTTSPRKGKSNFMKSSLVIIIPDFESFNTSVLQNFILIASSYINVLPFVLIFGVATSLTVLHRSLPYHVSSKVNIQVFNSQPSTKYLNNVIEQIFFSNDCHFHLGGKVFQLFVDIFLFYDLSVTGFIQNFKYAMLEHFSQGNLMALCSSQSHIKEILEKFSHDDLEEVRHLLTFRRLVENENYKNQIRLIEDDEYFKQVLETELIKIHDYMKNLHLFVKCLHILTCDLPKAPLGKQIRELYRIVIGKNLIKSQEYKESMQLLSFQSKNELLPKVISICEVLMNEFENNLDDDLFQTIEAIKTHLDRLTNDQIELEDDAFMDTSDGPKLNEQMDRKELKQRLLQMSKVNKPLNRYEKLRSELIQDLNKIFERHLVEPHNYNFHEIFFFNDPSIQMQIVGSHRAAIHTALNDPHHYLQCDCCEIPNDTAILRTMPDICIVYKLHLEYGKMINLYDWLQAFLSIVDPIENDEEDCKEVDPAIQARFSQAVAELEFLGFIKSSKRKTDHVARLTWGG